MASMVLDTNVVGRTVISREDLPEILMSHFRTKWVRFVVEDGNVTLFPVDAKRQLARIDEMCGRLAGRGWSSEEFIKNKRLEKELEV